jgi:hypothetical protein
MLSSSTQVNFPSVFAPFAMNHVFQNGKHVIERKGKQYSASEIKAIRIQVYSYIF